jgi:hypothetical protein
MPAGDAGSQVPSFQTYFNSPPNTRESPSSIACAFMSHMTLTSRVGSPCSPPAWRGFHPLRVSRQVRESSNVISVILEPTDKQALTAALPGQFSRATVSPWTTSS